MSERTINRGEVYYITSRPDTVGSEQKSGRPAVIVSNNDGNDHAPIVTVCYLTLQEKTPLPTHVLIERGQCVNSTILCEQVTTVSKDRLGDYMCYLPDDIMDKVDDALIVALGLDYIIDQKVKTEASKISVKTPVSTTSTPAKTSSSTDKALADLTTKVKSLEDEKKVMEAFITELKSSCEKAVKRAEEAEKMSAVAETYKTLYDNLLDKVLKV